VSNASGQITCQRQLEPSAVIAMLTGEVPDRRPALKVLSKVAVPTIVAAIKSADSSSVRGVSSVMCWASVTQPVQFPY
jgi:hypothetical protein